ncbi:MAG: quinoprotein glucose dehydrogenase [Patiriisocius sp.]|jgi:quinoprotein glucose dehydrogenase
MELRKLRRIVGFTWILTIFLMSSGSYGDQHTDLNQITPANVGELKQAFVLRTGDLNKGFRSKGFSLQATPVYWDGLLVVSTSSNLVIAANAESGKEVWRFDPEIDRQMSYSENASRGVSIWHGDDTICPDRIFIGTLSSKLFALNAKTGQLCENFGDAGSIDLSQGINNFRAGEYAVTSPVAVLSDRIIVGSAIGDNGAVELENGIVRAYDAVSGKLFWNWDPVPRDENNPAYRTWSGKSAEITGGANAWAPISVDRGRKIAFVPTSSPSPDFYGGERKGTNRNANSLVALNTDTGKVLWAQQLVHHDIWDYDLPAKPGLVTMQRNGRAIDAVVQVNKTGMVFAFDRETGAPLFPMEERPVPVSDIQGELSHPTQPFSSVSLMDQKPLTKDDAYGVMWVDKRACAKIIETYRNEGIFTPPSVGGSIQNPAYAGGMNWGGIALDGKRQIGVVNLNHIPALVKLLPRKDFNRAVVNNGMPGWQLTAMKGTPYGMARRMFLSELGLPCTKPPWGTLAAVDLNTGAILWQKPFGTIEDLAPAIVPNFEWGVPNMGGPLTTDSGLTFIGATLDYYFRAYDTETGQELWRSRLTTSANATPMSYLHKGKQYIAIAVGGHSGLGTPPGDEFIVFSR